jgi:hypothetical protein
MVRMEVLDRRLDAPPLLEQHLAEPVDVDHAHPRRSFPTADDRRRSI